MSNSVLSRISHEGLKSKVMPIEQALSFFTDDAWLGWSGFTGVGGPKAIPTALADKVEKESLQGKLRYNLITGASTDTQTESRWADLKMIKRRSPHQVGKSIQKGINTGEIFFFDKHLSMTPQDLMYDYYTKNRTGDKKKIDIALVEATSITKDGQLILGPSVGATPEITEYADNIVVELNTALPSFEGLHDINMPVLPPHRTPFPITQVTDRFGTCGLPIDPKKVIAVVETQEHDTVPDNSPSDAVSNGIAGHLVAFFEHEVAAGRMPPNLHPMQSGIGNVANAIVEGLAKSKFDKLDVWTEVFQDAFLDFLENGKLHFATATSIRLTQNGFKRFFSDFDQFSKKVLLRSQQISNHPEIIRRLGCIAMNTPVEVDIYGHGNSTCVNGSRMLNGLGGSADFLRNAKLSIMHTPSSRKSKTDKTGMSCVVPMCTHVDTTEHDLDIIVTEQGLADLRGLAPRERSREVISKCAHPDYKDQLMDYVKHAEAYCTKTKSLHEPHSLWSAFKMHQNLAENGTMKLSSW